MIGRAIAIAAACTGCLIKPDKVVPDGGVGFEPDADMRPFEARVISTAYFSSSLVSGSSGMTATGYSLSSNDVVVGDLVLLIATIDATSEAVFPTPPEFTPLVRRQYGSYLYAAFWKYATHADHGTYSGTYAGTSSGAAAIAAIAVHGAANVAPVVAANNGALPPAFSSFVASSDGVITTAANSIVVFAAGAQWQPTPVGMFGHTPPLGYGELAALTDRGGVVFDYTTMLVASGVQPAAGPTGIISATLNDVYEAEQGVPWTIAIGIAPR